MSLSSVNSSFTAQTIDAQVKSLVATEIGTSGDMIVGGTLKVDAIQSHTEDATIQIASPVKLADTLEVEGDITCHDTLVVPTITSTGAALEVQVATTTFTGDVDVSGNVTLASRTLTTTDGSVYVSDGDVAGQVYDTHFNPPAFLPYTMTNTALGGGGTITDVAYRALTIITATGGGTLSLSSGTGGVLGDWVMLQNLSGSNVAVSWVDSDNNSHPMPLTDNKIHFFIKSGTSDSSWNWYAVY